MTLEYLLRAEHAQPWLDGLRERIGSARPGFLRGYLDEARAGHETLARALEGRHRDGRLGEWIPREDVLRFEHR